MVGEKMQRTPGRRHMSVAARGLQGWGRKTGKGLGHSHRGDSRPLGGARQAVTGKGKRVLSMRIQ